MVHKQYKHCYSMFSNSFAVLLYGCWIAYRIPLHYTKEERQDIICGPIIRPLLVLMRKCQAW